MKATLVMLLVFVGCSNADTVCGQTLDSSRSSWMSVADLQIAENAFVGAARLVAGDARLSSEGSACSWLAGTRVVLMPSRSWVDEFSRNVSGLAYPGKDWTLTSHAPGGVVLVGSSASWRSSALVHEWLHVVEGGIPASPCGVNDDPHCGWGRVGGEYALIDTLAL